MSCVSIEELLKFLGSKEDKQLHPNNYIKEAQRVKYIETQKNGIPSNKERVSTTDKLKWILRVGRKMYGDK